ncbi:hypothetical protein ACIVBQ_000580 [Tenacibaculum discolor]
MKNLAILGLVVVSTIFTGCSNDSAMEKFENKIENQEKAATDPKDDGKIKDTDPEDDGEGKTENPQSFTDQLQIDPEKDCPENDRNCNGIPDDKE